MAFMAYLHCQRAQFGNLPKPRPRRPNSPARQSWVPPYEAGFFPLPEFLPPIAEASADDWW